MSSTAPSSFSLPPELTDYTIDFLHSDVSTLRSCALTCRTWQPSARYHLFTSLSIASTHSLSKITHLISSDPHTTSRITRYIRTLSISKSNRFEAIKSNSGAAGGRDANTFHPSDPFVIGLSHIPWETQLPRTFSTQFPSLTKLHLDGFLSFWQPASFSIASYAAFASIEILHLTKCSLKSFGELVGLVEALPKVTGLWLDGVSFGSGPRGLFSTENRVDQRQIASDSSRPSSVCDRRDVTGHVALTSLRIEHHSKPLDALFDWLLSTNSVDTLREVILPDLDGRDLEGVQMFLKELGEGLDRLDIGFRDCTSLSEMSVSLDANPNLTLLTLRLGGSNKWVSPLLNSLQGLYQLRALTFDSATYFPRLDDNVTQIPVDWEHLDQDLARFSSLRQILLKGLDIDGWEVANTRLERFRDGGGVVSLV